jgi:hypothetical protein
MTAAPTVASGRPALPGWLHRRGTLVIGCSGLGNRGFVEISG